jgi:hypothetical protein
MKTALGRILALATVGLIAACAVATPASAQNAFRGTFTLSNDVQWGNAKLPAGEYSILMKSAALPAQIVLEGPNGGSFILASSASKGVVDATSSITLEQRGGTQFVREIYLAPLQLRLRYGVAKQANDELAQEPEATGQVLIAMAKN